MPMDFFWVLLFFSMPVKAKGIIILQEFYLRKVLICKERFIQLFC